VFTVLMPPPAKQPRTELEQPQPPVQPPSVSVIFDSVNSSVLFSSFHSILHTVV